MRVRWALDEAGRPYEVRLVSFGAMKEPAHRALHPFGQIPTYEAPILDLQTTKFWRATRPGSSSACLSFRIAFVTGSVTFPVAWAMPTGSMVRSARAT
jgi:hypothetical protein